MEIDTFGIAVDDSTIQICGQAKDVVKHTMAATRLTCCLFEELGFRVSPDEGQFVASPMATARAVTAGLQKYKTRSVRIARLRLSRLRWL